MTNVPENERRAAERAADRAALRMQRCIDGELPEADERALLKELESSGQWRDLALGFLEDRVWQRAYRKPVATQPPLPQVKPTSTSGPRMRQALLAIAVGMTWGVAFGAGRFSVVPGNMPVAQKSPRGGAPSAAPEARPGNPNSVRSSSQPLMYVSFKTPGDSDDAAVRVPVFDARQAPANWNSWQEPALTREDVQRLRRQGYDVQSRKDYITWEPNEGGAVVFPVESVRVQPARY